MHLSPPTPYIIPSLGKKRESNILYQVWENASRLHTQTDLRVCPCYKDIPEWWEHTTPSIIHQDSLEQDKKIDKKFHPHKNIIGLSHQVPILPFSSIITNSTHIRKQASYQTNELTREREQKTSKAHRWKSIPLSTVQWMVSVEGIEPVHTQCHPSGRRGVIGRVSRRALCPTRRGPVRNGRLGGLGGEGDLPWQGGT